MARTEAVIVAAGRGVRLKAKTPKAFGGLKGKPLLYYSLKAFQVHPQISRIILVVDKKQLFNAFHLVKRYKFSKVAMIVRGGKERKDSVASGLGEVRKHAKYVLIHDAARPFVTSKLISDIIKALKNFDCAIPGIPVKDTVKYADSRGVVRATLKREGLFQIQTPQGIRGSLIKSILKNTKKRRAAYDDASLVEKTRKVKIVLSNPANIKITTPDDLALASLYLSV